MFTRAFELAMLIFTKPKGMCFRFRVGCFFSDAPIKMEKA